MVPHRHSLYANVRKKWIKDENKAAFFTQSHDTNNLQSVHILKGERFPANNRKVSGAADNNGALTDRRFRCCAKTCR